MQNIYKLRGHVAHPNWSKNAVLFVAPPGAGMETAVSTSGRKIYYADACGFRPDTTQPEVWLWSIDVMRYHASEARVVLGYAQNWQDAAPYFGSVVRIIPTASNLARNVINYRKRVGLSHDDEEAMQVVNTLETVRRELATAKVGIHVPLDTPNMYTVITQHLRTLRSPAGTSMFTWMVKEGGNE